MLRWLGWIVCIALLPTLASAQEAQLQVDRGPYYVGTPINLVVVAVGFDPDSEPVSEVTTPEGGSLTLVGVTPNRSSSVVIINGQVQRSSSVKYNYRYQFLASEPGRFRVGPFRIRQSGTERTTAPVTLDVRDVPRSPRLEVELELDSEVAYVGSRVRATLEYRIDSELERNIVRSNLQLPALDLRDVFRIDADESIPDDVPIELATSSGPVVLRARVRTETREGRPWTIVAIPFFMLPLQSGRFTLAATSLTVDAGVQFSRDIFGGRRATQLEKLRAVDVPRQLEVKQLPLDGRPPSFAGAVGRGYSFEVAADRSVVQVGDPIELTLTLRGDGLLESASLPELSAPGLLPEGDFSVPSGSLTGEYQAEAKVFKAVVRAKRVGVTEIPALEFSYFDPSRDRFETVRSRPIALSVRPAEVVDASRVVVPDAGAEAASGTPRASDAPSTEVDGADLQRSRRPGFDLDTVDLSIVREPERLAARRGLDGSGRWWGLGLYVASAGVLAGAFFERRRRGVDPEQASKRASLRQSFELVAQAAEQGDLDGVRALAGALRLLRADRMPASEVAKQLDQLLAECDAEIYAPGERSERSQRFRELGRRGLELARRGWGDLA